ncbi:MAG: SPASM domain-containing protein [Rhodospirillaceae bacterium]|nr:SPASM domain-containing protein [Rhodospirillaceae bacterium]
MDKNIIKRMQYIEASAIETHLFYTNLIGANKASIESLFAMKKLSFMEISVYGHDLDSFRNITGRGEEQYRRLIDNLAILESLYPLKSPDLNIVIGIRTYRSFQFGKNPNNGLLEKIEILRKAGVKVGLSCQIDNWGGDITQSDIADIEMDLSDGKNLYRKGPCGLPFDSIQITATGKVNACACRDPRGSLMLGDISNSPLADILSSKNEKWMKIISDHESGHFNEVCSSCGFYRSIYDERRVTNDGFMTKQDFFNLI